MLLTRPTTRNSQNQWQKDNDESRLSHADDNSGEPPQEDLLEQQECDISDNDSLTYSEREDMSGDDDDDDDDEEDELSDAPDAPREEDFGIAVANQPAWLPPTTPSPRFVHHNVPSEGNSNIAVSDHQIRNPVSLPSRHGNDTSTATSTDSSSGNLGKLHSAGQANTVLSELHKLTNANARDIAAATTAANISGSALEQYGYMYGAYPRVSAPSLSTESDISSESDIASDAGRYIRRHRRRESRGVRNTSRAKSNSIRNKKSRESERSLIETVDDDDDAEDDWVCAHCATPNMDDYLGYVTTYSCCVRKSHTACVIHNPTACALLHGEYASIPPASIGEIVTGKETTPCLSCLRPLQLLRHKDLLEEYTRYFEQLEECQQQNPESSSSSSSSLSDNGWRIKGEENKSVSSSSSSSKPASAASGLFNRIFRSKSQVPSSSDGIVVVDHKQQQQQQPNRDGNGPDVSDAGGGETVPSIPEMVRGGRTLHSIVETMGLHRIDDEYEELWNKMGFNKEVLFALPDTDLLFYMKHFQIHPYRLRWIFGITLEDLWVNDATKLAAVHKYMDRHPTIATLDVCEKFGILSPVKLAIMGFDVHHMLQMGFTKEGFSHFPAYSMSDWINTLGFCKPHWWLLRFTIDDLTGAAGSGSDDSGEAFGRGWSISNLVAEWNLEITDLRNMRLIDVETMLSQLETPGMNPSYENTNLGGPSRRRNHLHQRHNDPSAPFHEYERGYHSLQPSRRAPMRESRYSISRVARQYGV